MKYLANNFAVRLLHAMQRRFVRSRSGSVLILVVALLVILALIGTAWMSSARNDRYGATQNTTNTQIDLLVEGAIALVQGVVVDDLFGTVGGVQVYRPSGDATLTGYAHYDVASSPLATIPSDSWLADRIPINSGGVGWLSLTAPFNEDAGDASIPKRPYFHDPRLTGSAHFEIAPKVIARPDVATTADGKEYPAIRFGTNTYLAADADGDGIADSVLWKLPIAPIDGVTYYVAYRVIDNSSAINANIAWSANEGPVVGLPGNFFPTNVSLLRMLRDEGGGFSPVDQMQRLTEHRFDNTLANVNANYATALWDDGTAGGFDFQSPYDAFWMQYGRRTGNPGLSYNGVPLRGLSMADSMALAYHFCLINPDASRSLVEEFLDGSVYEAAWNFNSTVKAYAPSDVNGWFNNNFNYDNEVHTTNPANTSSFMPIRALLTASNPVANMVPDAPLVAGMGTFGTIPVKVALTAADFEDLYRAFWSVMAERWTTSTGTIIPGTPFGATEDPATGAAITTAPLSPNIPTDVYQGNRIPAVSTDTHDYRMFRTSLRDPRASTADLYFRPEQMMRIRAALAAVNAIDLRDTDNNVTRRSIVARMTSFSSGASVDVDVDVYGTENQCYITEVFAHTDTLTPGPTAQPRNENGYIAIELFNPHGEDVSIIGWKLVAVERPLAATYPLPAPVVICDDISALPGAPTFITGNGRIVLENHQNLDATVLDPTAAQHRPGSQNLPVQESPDDINTVYVPNLHLAFNRELVLMRPLLKDVPNPNFDENCPIDQYDFTGLELYDGSTVMTARAWHYVRENDDSAKAWNCVYPGRYDAHRTDVIVPAPRHEGTDSAESWTPDGASILDPWNPATVNPDPDPDPPTVDLNGSDDDSEQRSFTIQLSNAAWAGPNPTGPAAFPFGNFARNGDVLQVPFIGGYRVTESGGLYELNSVTIDSSFAEDADSANDEAENLGRFCPIDPRDLATPKAIGDSTAESDDFNDEGEYGNPNDDDAAKPNVWRYRWAMDIFDYLTVQAPHKDFFPEAHDAGFAGTPQEVDSDGNGTANDDPERALPIQGLVNINTAPWKVLASLPMVLLPNGEIDWVKNVRLAQEIVLFRDFDDGSGVPFGPFQSIFDLNRVFDSTDPAASVDRQGFRDAMDNIPDMTTFEADDNDGDLSPLGQGGTNVDGVTNDFETRFLVLNRISNLITTRSDSFTAYILVQGWLNAESTDPLNPPKLLTQRRVGVILDRSGVVSTTTKGNLSTTRFPQN